MKINTEEAQKRSPRPHFLVGEAEYEKNRLRAKVLFSSSRDSIGDRVNNEVPHVNIGDVCFAMWNAGHIVAEQERYSFRILTDEVKISLTKYPVPADRELGLEFQAEVSDVLQDSRGKDYRLAQLEGRIYDSERLLITVNAGVFIRP